MAVVYDGGPSVGSTDTAVENAGGFMVDMKPSTVQDEARNGGGFTKLNTPTSNPGNPVAPASDNVGMRGYYNDHDADDKNLHV